MKSRGFTLLEVLIALAIVALAVGALLGSVTSSASNVIYLKDKTLAEWVALNRLTEVRIAQQMPDKGKRTGNAEMAGQKWQWEEEVIELPVKGMFRVEIRARATGENADDNKTLQKATAQKESDSKSASSDLDKLNWTSTVTGVVGTSNSARREALAAQYAGVPTTAGSSGDGKTTTPGTGTPDR
ncbi:MAG: type II secretion system minor pseudopilin GspI [Nocardioides sp.]